MQSGRALLLIADIGGYTEFMRSHRMSLAHAEVNTARLLETVIDAAGGVRADRDRRRRGVPVSSGRRADGDATVVCDDPGRRLDAPRVPHRAAAMSRRTCARATAASRRTI